MKIMFWSSPKNKAWNGIIATINYDRLLYLAFRNNEINPQGKILFLHGACNIYMGSAIGCFPNPRMRVKDNIADSYPFAETEDIYESFPTPILSHYHFTKRPQNGCNLVEDQQKQFKKILKIQAKNIVIVGVNFASQDSHIWGKEALGGTKANIYYFNTSKASRKLEKEWAFFNPQKHKTIPKFFEEGFEDICQYAGLN